MKKVLLSILTLTAICTGATAQNVNIPDANFKAYLLGNASINTDADPNEISVTEAGAFTGNVNCQNLSISDLTGIEAFTSILYLYCNNNSISSLDLSQNTSLTELRCNSNSLSALDLSQNTALTSIKCEVNSLTSLNVTQNTLLDYLKCTANSLNSLDISQNLALTELLCEFNSISSLDLSQHTSLIHFRCQNNALSYLNVANGNNSNVTYFLSQNNPALTCITVDDVAYSTTNWTNIDAGVSFSTNCPPPPCVVAIPDANFKAYLVGNTLINTNGDTEIQCSEASAFAGVISCPSLSIADLTGIEAFTSIGILYCNDNLLTSLDVSLNSALTALYCNDNQLAVLSISNNTLLSNLHCDNNVLTGLDVTANVNLKYLHCYENQISNLNLSQNLLLEELAASDNNLTTLDVTLNTVLEDLQFEQNQVSIIDLSQNTLLDRIFCRNTLLTNLDCSSNSSLYWIVANDNPNLETIDVSNGNNTNVALFWANNSPSLTCIKVDDVSFSNMNWVGSSFNFDAASNFNINCSILVNSITVQGQGGVSTITTQGGTLQMEVTILPINADDATYTWSVANGSGSASITASGLLTALTNGTVDVTATANDASGETGTMTVTVSNQNVELNEVDRENISIYPNPVQSELFIESTEGKIIEMTILDYSGRTIKSITDVNVKSIDVSALNQGIYILKVSTGNGVSTNRFVKY